MKKVLFIYGQMGSGGAERVLIQVLKKLDRTKYKIDLALITADYGETLKYIPKDISVISLWNGYSLSYRLAYGISRILGCNYLLKSHIDSLLDDDYDVEVSFLEGMPLKLHYLRSTKAKRINWLHIDIDKFRYASQVFYQGEQEEYKAYKSMNEVVCVSKDVEEAFLRRFPSMEEKSCVIYNSIDCDDVRNRAKERDVKNTVFTVIAVGRLVEQKAFDRLIRVAEMCKRAGMEIKFQIIGEGVLEKVLKQLAYKLGVDDVVSFLGYMENPMPYIKSADVLLSTSVAEGFGLSICEAMCLGTPVVSTKAAGPCEILDDDKYGLLCEHSDESIFQTLKRLYDDKKLRDHFSELGKERIKIFDATTTVRQIETLL